MSSMVAEEVSVTKPGATFAPPKDHVKKVQFMVPNSTKIVSIEPQRPPRKPPSHIQFGMLHNRQLRMTRSIPLDIERKKDTVVASWAEIDEFGYGRNISEALDDFGKTVEELFLTLHERQASLSEDLVRIWLLLSQHIEFKQRG